VRVLPSGTEPDQRRSGGPLPRDSLVNLSTQCRDRNYEGVPIVACLGADPELVVSIILKQIDREGLREVPISETVPLKNIALPYGCTSFGPVDYKHPPPNGGKALI